jgi:staphylococcal nuclease domain-containing protein 1
MWRDYTPPAALVAKGGKPLEFVGTVTKIITTDMIMVSMPADGTDRKITFSSIRGLKIKEPKEAAYNGEAREFLRSKLIGKDVKVTVKKAGSTFKDYLF